MNSPFVQHAPQTSRAGDPTLLGLLTRDARSSSRPTITPIRDDRASESPIRATVPGTSSQCSHRWAGGSGPGSRWGSWRAVVNGVGDAAAARSARCLAAKAEENLTEVGDLLVQDAFTCRVDLSQPAGIPGEVQSEAERSQLLEAIEVRVRQSLVTGQEFAAQLRMQWLDVNHVVVHQVWSRGVDEFRVVGEPRRRVAQTIPAGVGLVAVPS